MLLRNLSFWLTAFVLLFCQVHPFLAFGKQGIRPDLVFILIVFIGIKKSPCRGAMVCFLLGYCVEVLSGANSGLYISVYISAFTAIKVLERIFNFSTLAEFFLLLLVCFCLKLLVFYFSFVFVYEYKLAVFRTPFFAETFLTLALFPILFPLISHFNKERKPIERLYDTLKHVH